MEHGPEQLKRDPFDVVDDYLLFLRTNPLTADQATRDLTAIEVEVMDALYPDQDHEAIAEYGLSVRRHEIYIRNLQDKFKNKEITPLEWHYQISDQEQDSINRRVSAVKDLIGHVVKGGAIQGASLNVVIDSCFAAIQEIGSYKQVPYSSAKDVQKMIRAMSANVNDKDLEARAVEAIAIIDAFCHPFMQFCANLMYKTWGITPRPHSARKTQV